MSSSGLEGLMMKVLSMLGVTLVLKLSMGQISFKSVE